MDQVWGTASEEQTGRSSQGRQGLLKFLSDIFDVRIMIFDRDGNITGTSEEQIVPGSKIEGKNFFLKLLARVKLPLPGHWTETGRLILSPSSPWATTKMLLKTTSCWKQGLQS